MRIYTRKYPKVEGWWCYCLIFPDGMFYIGCSKQEPNQRWRMVKYKNLTVYIEKYGWDNIRKVVLCDGLTKEQSLQLEDLLIQEARKGGWCLNQKRSGGERWTKNSIEYQEYLKSEQYKSVVKKSLLKTKCKPEYKIYDRVHSFNNYHPDRIIETPLEAKQKYLQRGYIPDYIKSDDLR